MIPLRTAVTGIDCIDTVVLPVRSPNGLMWLPYAVRDDIRTQLKRLLKQLPPLRFPLSGDEENDFIKRFLCLPPDLRPRWVPVLLQRGNLQRDQHRRHSLFGQLRKELMRDPDFHPCDARHRPCAAEGEAFLDGELARRILRKRCLLEKVSQLAFAEAAVYERLDAPPPAADALRRYPGFPKSLELNGFVSEEWLIRTFLELKPPSSAQPPAAEEIKQTSTPDTVDNDDMPESTIKDNQISKPKVKDVRLNRLEPPRPLHEEAPTPAATIDRHQHRPAANPGEKLLSVGEVAERVGKRRSTVYNRIDESHPSYDPDFPKPKQSGPRQAKSWLASEVDAYILSRPTAN